MPTNILVWNIQFFTNNKISMANSTWLDLVDTAGNTVDGTFDSLMRLEYIIENIKFTPPPLNGGAHIFVLIENLSAQGQRGSLAGGNGAIGARLLLDRIRGATLDDNWMMVPPLKLVDQVQIEEQDGGGVALVQEGAYTECISVFYRNDLLDFVGPYVWPAAAPAVGEKVAQRNTGQATGPYPDEWEGTYPAGNHFAGQFEYFTNPVARTGEILFPDVGSRRPFFTQFRERAAPGRLISLASVHYPPRAVAAGPAFARTMDYFRQANYPIQANEVLLIAGDYNLNYLAHNGLSPVYLQAAHHYGFYVALGNGPNQQNVGSTMIRRANVATPTAYRGTAGYDNIAFRFGAAAAPFQPAFALYNRVNGPPGIPSLMYTPPATINALPAPEPQNTVFRLQQNFRYMGPVPGVSDHLPLFMSF